MSAVPPPFFSFLKLWIMENPKDFMIAVVGFELSLNHVSQMPATSTELSRTVCIRSYILLFRDQGLNSKNLKAKQFFLLLELFLAATEDFPKPLSGKKESFS